MLNALFLKHALNTKPEWNNRNWYPNKGRDYTVTHYPQLQHTYTHCGTAELQHIDSVKATYDFITKLLCYAAIKVQNGSILYYAPHRVEYEEAVKKLKNLGFEELYQSLHLGFLKRKPDKGVFTVYHLQITPKDVAKLKKLKCLSKKELAQAARRQTRSTRSPTARNTVSPVAITNIPNGV